MRLFKKKKVKLEELFEIRKNMDDSIVNWDNANLDEIFGEIEETEEMTVKDDFLLLTDAEGRRKYVENYCEKIVSCSQQIEDNKIELHSIEEYLYDVRKIKDLPQREKDNLIAMAKRVIVLKGDRETYRKRPSRLNDRQFQVLFNNEENMPKIIKSMEIDEERANRIKNDMHHLEGEKGALRYEIQDLERRKEHIKQAAKLTASSFIILTVLFIMAMFNMDIDVGFMPYYIIIIAGGIGVFLLLINQKTEYVLKLSKMKLNRVITVLNKIKIQYVNVKARLDYESEKYATHNSTELGSQWRIYQKYRKEQQVYQKTSESLYSAENELAMELKKIDLHDDSVWNSQLESIISNTELNEMYMDLERRYQKIKSVIDHNTEIVDISKKRIKELIDSYKEYAQEIIDVVDAYEKKGE